MANSFSNLYRQVLLTRQREPLVSLLLGLFASGSSMARVDRHSPPIAVPSPPVSSARPTTAVPSHLTRGDEVRLSSERRLA